MPVCVINQPGGLGDIIWIQPIVDHMIDRGYEVVYPVKGVYYEMLKRSLEKPGLEWVLDSEDHPMKDFFGSVFSWEKGDDIYLPIQYANRHIPYCPVMISKYYMMGLPITNWHNNLIIKRNSQREDRVFSVYGIDRNSPYSLLNLTYGTPPNLNRTRELDIKSRNEQRVLMSIEIDGENDICLFDWLGVIENADEIHSVETAFCYLADKYSRTPRMNMHEKRQQNEPNVYYRLTSLVYRNPNWTYYG